MDPSAGGKTTTINWQLSRNKALNPPDRPPRHFGANVPSPVTLKSLGLEILKGLGLTEVSERAKVWEIWNTARHRLWSCGIVVLWIDEAQDLFLCRSAREIDDMLWMLKTLMQGETAVIVILSGTERLAEITSWDPQVNRRFTKVVPNALVIGADEAKVTRLVQMYAGKAGLRLDWSDPQSSRLIHASRRRFGRAVETIINAIERAARDGDMALNATHFAEAWGMQEGCAWEENVFVASGWAKRTLDGGAEAYEAARRKRQHDQMGRS